MRVGLSVAVLALGAVISAAGALRAQAPSLPVGADRSAMVHAALTTERPVVEAGAAVWVNLSLTNLTDQPLTLQVPGAPAGELSQEGMGLPLTHVFSGEGFTAITVTDKNSRPFDTQVAVPPRGSAPVVKLAPHGSIGLRLDLARFYPVLHRPNTYTLVWKPYQGTLKSNALTIHVMAERQAVVMTDLGSFTMRFYFDKAPRHVENFIDLVEQRFYEGLTFHRVIPGGIIQGGDPRRDGYGIRKDGRRLEAEFNDIPFERGTVGMARAPGDPNSASCQFFICLSRQPSFDGNQTAFAHIVGDESFETLDRIAAVPTDSRDRPRQPVYIRAISLQNVPMRERAAWQAPPRMGTPTTRPALTGGTRGVLPSLDRKPPERVGLSAVRRPKKPATRPAGSGT